MLVLAKAHRPIWNWNKGGILKGVLFKCDLEEGYICLGG